MRIFVAILMLCQLPTPQAAKSLPELREHEWGKLCLTMAEWPGGAYGDFGQWDLLLYQIHGDKARARKAIAKFRPLLAAPADRNTSREYGLMVPYFYGWLKAEMTPAELKEWEAALNGWAQMIVGFNQWGPNTRLDDSDVLLSHYTTLRAIDRRLGSTYCDLAPAKAMREAFRGVIRLAKGGVLPESSDYDPGTNQLLILGCADDWDHFPEVREWLPELAQQLQWEWTPDLKEVIQWGDVQKPHGLEIHARLPLMLQVIGLGGDKDGRLAQLAATLLQTHKPDKLYHNLYRAMWCIDPRTLPATPRYEAPQGLRVTRDHVIYRTTATLWHVFAAAPTGLDHQMSQSECRLWHKGKWILDSPRGYQPWPTNQNAGLVFGLEPVPDRGLRSADLTADGCKVVLETKGPRFLTGWDHQLGQSAPTPSYIDLWRQTLTLAPGKLTRADRFQGSKPTRLDRYPAWEKAAVESSPAYQQLWHAPPGSTPKPIDGGFTWLCGDVPLTLTSNRSARVEQTAIGTNLGTYVEPSEEGGWLIRFEHDELPAEIESTLRWDEPEKPPTDRPVKGVLRGKQLIIELP